MRRTESNDPVARRLPSGFQSNVVMSLGPVSGRCCKINGGLFGGSANCEGSSGGSGRSQIRTVASFELLQVLSLAKYSLLN